MRSCFYKALRTVPGAHGVVAIRKVGVGKKKQEEEAGRRRARGRGKGRNWYLQAPPGAAERNIKTKMC